MASISTTEWLSIRVMRQFKARALEPKFPKLCLRSKATANLFCLLVVSGMRGEHILKTFYHIRNSERKRLISWWKCMKVHSPNKDTANGFQWTSMYRCAGPMKQRFSDYHILRMLRSTTFIKIEWCSRCILVLEWELNVYMPDRGTQNAAESNNKIVLLIWTFEEWIKILYVVFSISFDETEQVNILFRSPLLLVDLYFHSSAQIWYCFAALRPME